MTVFDDSLVEFQKLPHEEKKSELLKLLSKFKDIDDIFVKLINSVNSKNYTDRVLL